MSVLSDEPPVAGSGTTVRYRTFILLSQNNEHPAPPSRHNPRPISIMEHFDQKVQQ